MFIQIEKTPEEATLHFLPGRTVLESAEIDFADRDAAQLSPLATRLFDVRGVAAVSLGPEFVAVTRDGDADWQILKPAVLGVIMEHFLADRPVLSALPAGADAAPDHDPGDAEVVAEIEELLETRIRPTLESDGAGVVLRSFRSGVAEIELAGSKMAAPVFSIKIRIENTLRHYIPEVEEVRIVQPQRSAAEAAIAESLDFDDPEVAAVHTLLEEQINPSVAAHGGHISLIDVKDHNAYIRLEGGCQGCGMADVTLKQGVEQAIKEAVPTIIEVLDCTDHAGGTNPFYEPDKGGMSPF